VTTDDSPRPRLGTQRRRPRVLIIDDEELLLRSMKRALQREVDVVTTTSASDAISRLEGAEAFDVIVSDLMMPGTSGLDLHRHLERHAPELAARMVFMTGGTFTAEAREFRDRVPNVFLDKPVDVQELRATIERVAASRPREE
jgi:two-component system NtrC family sensor kinase